MGLGFIVIFLLIQFIAILYWLLNHGCCAQMTCAGWVYTAGTTTATTAAIILVTEPWILCTDDMCRMGVYIWGSIKILCCNKMYKKNTFLFS